MRAEIPLDDEEYPRWREKADSALAGARLQADAGLHNWACFAAEQAAQLGVKALVHGLGRAPWGHDLVRLSESIAAARVDVPADVANAARRPSRYYIPARNPDAHPGGSAASHYGHSDSQDALHPAELVLAVVDRPRAALDA